MQRILKDPAVVAKLKDLSFIPAGESRETFAVYITAEIAKWGAVIQTAGVTID